MSKQDLNQLRTETIEQLRVRVFELKQDLTRLKLEVQSGKTQSQRPTLLADQIARIETIIREKELSI